jgi:hypothetical protein
MISNDCNFLGEKYLNTDENLYSKLKTVATELKENINSKSIPVSKLISEGRPEFRKLMETKGFLPNLIGDKKLPNEFQGLYVFSDNERPIYIGMSRAIMRRILGHIKVDNKNYASLAYLMAKKQYAETHDGDENIPMGEIKGLIKRKQEDIKKFSFTVKLIGEETPSQHAFMHMAENFCANYFKAHWNSFKTH